MKRNTVIGLIVAFVGAFLFFVQYKKYNIPPKVAFPDLELVDLYGKPVDWNTQQKPVFINFFGTWCVDCIKEMPDLVILYSSLQRAGIDMILISEEPIETLNKYKSSSAIPMKIYHSNRAFKDLGIFTYPTSYLINKDQKLEYSATRVQNWTSEKLKNELIESVK
jgi:thiol-disulfide isomerase/thioredoxin